MSSWTSYVDGYCERVEPGFWAEPLNALTNLAFLIGALLVWNRLSKGGDLQARVLAVILAMIGIGSFLFHTFATRWAALTDVLPIAAFVLYFLYLANRYCLEMRVLPALLTTLLFFVYAPAATWAIGVILPGIGASAAYASIALLIFIYAGLAWRRDPDTGAGLAFGGTALVISIGFRIADLPLCDLIPVGTHIMWHLLNAVMLSWMILVMRSRIAATGMKAPGSGNRR